MVPGTRKNDASYKHSEERLYQSVPLSTGYFREFVLMKSKWFSSPALHGIMTQCYFPKIPKTCTYFVTCDCEAVETTQVSPPSAAAGPTPHIFETWLHSFWVTSLYTCPLHLTHFNHQMTCHSHYIGERVLLGARAGQVHPQVSRGTEEDCCPLRVSGSESCGSELSWWSTQMDWPSIR